MHWYIGTNGGTVGKVQLAPLIVPPSAVHISATAVARTQASTSTIVPVTLNTTVGPSTGKLLFVPPLSWTVIFSFISYSPGGTKPSLGAPFNLRVGLKRLTSVTLISLLLFP